MKQRMHSALLVGLVTFTLASLGHLVSSQLLWGGFGGLYRMYMYHEQYPYGYIAIVSVVFAITSQFWLRHCHRYQGGMRWLSMLAVMLLTVILSSIPGGVLWTLHDMRAGFYTEGARFWNDLRGGAGTGLVIGWLVIAISIPYNIVGCLLGGFLLHRLGLREQSSESEE